jgi:hypothetical protein
LPGLRKKKNDDKKVQMARWRRGGECLLERKVCLSRVFKNKNPELPFYLIMTSLTFVFNLSKIIIFTEGHV